MRILLFGFGVTGIASAKVFDALSISYDILDDKGMDELEHLVREEKVHPDRMYHSYQDIEKKEYDYILKSPGIPPKHPTVAQMIEENLPLVSDLELIEKLLPGRHLIGITGTNGKTTTVSLIGEILRHDGREVYVTGNIGRGALYDAFTAQAGAELVVECSSFQLEFVRTFRPEVAGILNITPDHLDWHGSLAAYEQAKSRIAASLGEDDIFIANADDPKTSVETRAMTRSISVEGNDATYTIEDGWICERHERILPIEEINLVGRHNLENVLMAVAVARARGVEPEVIREAVRDFHAVAHRIEFVRELDGVRYYDDSKGTNVDASIKAIESFEKGIILIAGGYDKKVEIAPLFEAFGSRVKALVLLGATRYEFEREAKSHGFTNYEMVDTMERAVKAAHALAQAGDVVLLSPASASWDMYRSYEERGDHFKRLVRAL